MNRIDPHVQEIYDRHPISAEQILHSLRTLRGNLDGLEPSDLREHDQDHYGGIDANRKIAAHARLAPGMHLVDFCAGLGGPARYFADHYGAIVTGIELNGGRAVGAMRLNELVGLNGQVAMMQGDVAQVALGDACADVVISQEALLHVREKAAALAEAARVLRDEGRLVFSDWVVHGIVSHEDAELLWQGLAAQTLQSIPSYGELLRFAGFRTVEHEDLTAEWADILEKRFQMYQELAEERRRAGMAPGEEAFYRAYEVLVRLVRTEQLGGARFSARK